MATLPTIAAVVGVCDEHELIARCIAHLEAQHVSSIVVVDNGSTDGTREILRELRRQGRVALIETAGDPRRDSDYFQRGIALAKERFKPDWILVQDADEFWVHEAGNLRVGLAGISGESLTINRFNACLSPHLTQFARDAAVTAFDLEIFTSGTQLTRTAMNENDTLLWIAAQPGDKVITRADALFAVTAGGHVALGRCGEPLFSRPYSQALIVHVPFLSLARFERKVRNVRSLIGSHESFFPGATAWHWKRWIGMLDLGGIEGEFLSQHVGDDSRDELRRLGAIRTPRAFFSGH